MRQSQRECRRRAGRHVATLALGLIGWIAAAAGLPASAAEDPSPRRAPQAVTWHAERVEARTVQRAPVSLQEAVSLAQRRFPGGRVVRAETRMRNGERVHEIRIIDGEGRVRTVRIDADSGEIR